MGTWGPGILQDDVAADVRVMFDDALTRGLGVERASREVLRELPGEMITDDDDGPVIMLALAALQLQHQALDPDVRDQALAAIASGAPIARWEAASLKQRAVRARILEQFEAALRWGECDSADLQRMIDSDEGRIW